MPGVSACCVSAGFALRVTEKPELWISWLPGDAYPCLRLEFTLRQYHTLLNVCVYYKAVLNVQCSNLMFQLIFDKYFPIMTWQHKEVSGTSACRTAPFLGNSNHVYSGKSITYNPLYLLQTLEALLLHFIYFYSYLYFFLSTWMDFSHLAGKVWHKMFCGSQWLEMSA